MRGAGYLLINGKKILVLWESKKTARLLKLRLTGRDGEFIEDESKYLEEEPEKIKALLNGKTIEC